MKILVTGGAGYIGSHTCIELINSGYEIVVIDNLCNSSQESIRRVEKLSKSDIPFYNIDVRNKVELTKLFEKYSFEGVVHFAGLKSVSDSISKQIDESVRIMVKQCYEETYSIVSKNRDAMDKIVDLLIEKETLDGEEFVKIL